MIVLNINGNWRWMLNYKIELPIICTIYIRSDWQTKFSIM